MIKRAILAVLLCSSTLPAQEQPQQSLLRMTPAVITVINAYATLNEGREWVMCAEFEERGDTLLVRSVRGQANKRCFTATVRAPAPGTDCQASLERFIDFRQSGELLRIYWCANDLLWMAAPKARPTFQLGITATVPSTATHISVGVVQRNTALRPDVVMPAPLS